MNANGRVGATALDLVALVMCVSCAANNPGKPIHERSEQRAYEYQMVGPVGDGGDIDRVDRTFFPPSHAIERAAGDKLVDDIEAAGWRTCANTEDHVAIAVEIAVRYDEVAFVSVKRIRGFGAAQVESIGFLTCMNRLKIAPPSALIGSTLIVTLRK